MSKPIHEDPIVNEVRAIRDAIARECNYDLRAIFARIKQHEQASGRQFVEYPAHHSDPPHGATEGAA